MPSMPGDPKSTGLARPGAPALCVLLLLTPLAAMADEPTKGASAPPPSVLVAAVVTKPVDRESRFVGTVKAIESVEVKARVEGFLEQVAFEQGGVVDSGALLYKIEQAPFQAALDSAKGQVAAAAASLDAANARIEDKQADFERQSVLVKKGDTSQTMFDQARAERDAALADVESAKASQQQAAAAQRNAEINLGYTTIASPIAGRIGATAVTVGNLVGPGSGTLGTVNQLDPIRVVFSVPSADFVRFQQRAASAGADAGDTTSQALAADVILPTGDTYAHTGTLAFADNQVDASTGTVAIYANFPNPDRLLLPGQYVTALLHRAQARRLPVVPAAALLRTRDGDQVYVVGDGNRVEARPVKTGPQIGADLAITSGVQEGELVIVSGLQKVQPGIVVAPSREQTPGDAEPEVGATTGDSRATTDESDANTTDGDAAPSQ